MRELPKHKNVFFSWEQSAPAAFPQDEIPIKNKRDIFSLIGFSDKQKRKKMHHLLLGESSPAAFPQKEHPRSRGLMFFFTINSLYFLISSTSCINTLFLLYMHQFVNGCILYLKVRWRAPSGPLAGKWAPAAIFRIDLYAGGASLGHLLGKALRRPVLVKI